MKKILYNFLLLLFLFLINVNVYARQVEGSDAAGSSTISKYGVSLNDNDYELVCIYDDGAELTITRNEIYIMNASNSIDSTANSGISFFLTSNQKNITDTSGKVTTSKADTLLENGHCPSKLYLYKVKSSEDDNVPEEERLDNVYNYYYSTLDGIAESIAGTHAGGFLWLSQISNAEQVKNEDGTDKTAKLKSEETNLITTKTALICDYQSKSESEDSFGSQSISIYIYENMSFLENGTRITPIKDKLTECPYTSSGQVLYLNNPTPRSVGGAYSGNYQYDSIRYYISSSSSTCKDNNNNNSCSKFEYVGSRNDTPTNSQEGDVCDLLGNETIKILRTIVSVLQIIVPALVIILIAIDISKMVLSGNIDEELPKKKKSIIIRLAIMVTFFFLPLIVGLIIQLLQEAGVNIGDIKCFFQ